ncbi:MAG: hypothetical protein GTO24_22610 [candidate division Zixibacteria bacterium]|nr:hypothetical protein [candidate division Zixibacteria bacterium]
MRGITKCVLSVALSVAVCGLFLMLNPSNAPAVQFGLYEINFLDATYDEGTNSTKFRYEVKAAVNYGFDDWTIELKPECFGPGDVIEASEPYVYVGPDPITGIYGLTFTTPYVPGQTRIVWFRMPGDLTTTLVKISLRWDCTYWEKEIPGPECPGEPGPEPPEGEGMSPGYWGNQLAIFLGYKGGKLKEPNVEAYADQWGYTAEEAYNILNYGGDEALQKMHRQLVAAMLSVAAGYLSNVDQIIADAQDMLANPGMYTEQEILDMKNLLESLHD